MEGVFKLVTCLQMLFFEKIIDILFIFVDRGGVGWSFLWAS